MWVNVSSLWDTGSFGTARMWIMRTVRTRSVVRFTASQAG
jgi:hypothetical protein